MAGGLAERLRAETRALHRQVEGSVFMAALVAGALDSYAYCLLLRNLEPIYAELELELEVGLSRHAHNPYIRPVIHPPLFRQQALRRDLDTLYGQRWREEIELMPSCAAYVARLRRLHEFEPELLVAHAYVRYLGDLSGGQRLAEIVRRSLCIPVDDRGSCGIDFFKFGEPDDVLKLSLAFRVGLDSLVGNGIPAEEKLAFEMHGRLFEELSSCCGLSDENVTVPD